MSQTKGPLIGADRFGPLFKDLQKTNSPLT